MEYLASFVNVILSIPAVVPLPTAKVFFLCGQYALMNYCLGQKKQRLHPICDLEMKQMSVHQTHYHNHYIHIYQDQNL